MIDSAGINCRLRFKQKRDVHYCKVSKASKENKIKMKKIYIYISDSNYIFTLISINLIKKILFFSKHQWFNTLKLIVVKEG